jgi:L-alanine-DL-glutamate epimerase-like enolase superfamily enzyme
LRGFGLASFFAFWRTFMKITDIKVQSYSYPTPPLRGAQFGTQEEATLVRVITDEGLEGYGVARAVGGSSGRVVADAVIRTAKPRVLGQDAFNRELIWQKLWALDRGNHLPIFATSVIDVALWDLAGKALGVPVWKLLGGYRDKLPAYASSARLATEDDYVTEAMHYRDRGFPAYKLHPFADPDKDIAVCRAVRKAVGPDMALMLDASCEYDHESALRVGREIEKLNFYWYEEPINAYDLRGYAELCRALEIPVVAAEMVAGSIRSTAQYISQGAGDILRADVYWRGGITAVMKTAHLCEAYGIKTELHHGASPLMDIATLHCACAIKNCEFLELLVPQERYEFGLKDYRLLQIDAQGDVHAPSGLGLGVDIDWDFIDNHTTYSA